LISQEFLYETGGEKRGWCVQEIIPLPNKLVLRDKKNLVPGLMKEKESTNHSVRLPLFPEKTFSSKKKKSAIEYKIALGSTSTEKRTHRSRTWSNLSANDSDIQEKPFSKKGHPARGPFALKIRAILYEGPLRRADSQRESSGG